MNWDNLLADLESRFDAERRADLAAEAAELAEAEIAGLHLADRLRGAVGRTVHLRTRGGAAVDGVVRRADCVPGAREAMLALYEQGYTIAMVADGLVESFHNTMTQNGLDHIFSAKAISEALETSKPDAKMFQYALDALGLKIGQQVDLLRCPDL